MNIERRRELCRTLINIRSMCAIVFAVVALSAGAAGALLGGLAVWMWYEARR